jgi:SRSO17 transposase
MFKIVRFPSKLEHFFNSMRTEFRFGHFVYFKFLVLLIALSWERRNIQALYRYLDPQMFPHRTRFNNFLHVERWNPEKTLAKKALEILQQLPPKKGDTMYLILDDSKKHKRGTKMDAVGWLFDHLTKKHIRGHQYVKATISFRGYTIPWGIRLYVKKEHSPKLGIPFKKITELAAELIRSFTPPEGVNVLVLFDSYYLCTKVTQACRSKKFHFVSTLKSNRNLYVRGRKLKAGTYGTNFFRRKSKSTLKISKERNIAKYKYVDAGWITVSKLGKLHIIFSRKNKERLIMGIVTDHPTLTAPKMVISYEKRWSIEVFFKDSKQFLGLGHYQNRPYRAVVTHLHLVSFAYALLTHIAIESSCAQEKQPKQARESTSVLQNRLRCIVWEDTAQYLKDLPDEKSVFKELSRLLIAA